MVGKIISHYQMLEKLGEGGMGVVYKARDTHLDRFVAIKVLSPERVADPERKRRFVQEAKAASALNHPNIIHIYDIDQQQGIDFIAMEYVPGKTLDQLISRKGMRLNDALKAAVQIADALATAHAAGIVHRDVKPSNLMVTEKGHVKVLDFGLAKLTEPIGPEAATVTARTVEGTIVGTVAYMSPEQAQGKPVDARSDIFSFGSLLYEMLTSEHAFRGDSNISTLAAILHEEPKPVGQIVDGLPREIERLISRCLRKDLKHRFQHMDDLKVAFEELKEESDAQSSEAAPPLGPKRGRKWAAVALGVPVIAVGAMLAGLALSPYLSNRWSSRATPIRSLAVLPILNTTGGTATDHLCDSLTENLINSLSEIPQPNLLVKSRLSVERYKNKQSDYREIGEALGVDAVLTGRIENLGQRLLISVGLTDARNGMHLWGKTFERKSTDLLDVHKSISDEVTESLRLRLSAEDKKHLRVYQLYQSAHYYWGRRTSDHLKRAINLFQQAISEDPYYAPAHAGLANCNVLLHYYGGIRAREAYPNAEKAAEEALRLDPTLAEAHATLALTRRDYYPDWAGAELEFRRAIDLNPSFDTARQWYGEHLTCVRRFDEALAQIQRARDLAPNSLAVRAVYGWILLCTGRVQEATELLQATLEKDPDYALTRWFLGQAYAEDMRYDRAIAELERVCKLSPGASRMVADLGRVYGISGKRTEARGIMNELRALSSRNANVSQYEFAVVHAGLGEFDQAFEALEKAYEERTWQVALLAVDPMLGRLRADPRYSAMVRRLKLPPR